MIYTFYSFKGGVGRSMALANIAELLYQRGLKVLMIDFDLEAPGLERYFDIEEAVHSPAEVLKRRGVIEMLISYKKIYALYRLTNRKAYGESREAEEPFPFPVEPLSRFVTPIYPENTTGASLSLLSAGKRDGDALTDYAEQMRLFDWDDFYRNWDGERFFEWLRPEAEAACDVVLIDSRTGVSEMSGVCTHQLADAVVMFVAPNYQNLAGTELIARSLSNPDLIDKGRHGRTLSLLFVPSRVDSGDRDLFDQFADHFRELCNKFLDSSLLFRQDPFLDLRIPYQTYYSYMENVALRTRQRASAADLIEAYENIASILAQLAPSESVIHQLYYPSLSVAEAQAHLAAMPTDKLPALTMNALWRFGKRCWEPSIPIPPPA
jgi:MinD-like ATPase involved in chromosome partitioning or flagellar assembly